ncbi:MAG: hypothetical protein AAB727_00515 [Patescibacteria group bacterium]
MPDRSAFRNRPQRKKGRCDMENLWIFAATVSVYFFALLVLHRAKYNAPMTSRQALKRLGILLLVCVPLNTNGYVFTIAGNAVGEKGVCSLFSLYQKTSGTAFTVATPFVWQEGESTAVVAGIAGNQKAGRNAFLFVGIAANQTAGKEAGVVFGIAGNQKSGGSAGVMVGIAGNQEAEKEAFTILGIAVHQKVKDKERTFGALYPLTAE